MGVHASFPVFVRIAYSWLLIALALGIRAAYLGHAMGRRFTPCAHSGLCCHYGVCHWPASAARVCRHANAVQSAPDADMPAVTEHRLRAARK